MSRTWLGRAHNCICGVTVNRDMRTSMLVDQDTGWSHKCTFQHRYEDAEMRPSSTTDNTQLLEKIDGLTDAMLRLVEAMQKRETALAEWNKNKGAVKR